MSNAKIKLVVFNEHTLGYILPELPNYVQILHASVLKGATWSMSKHCDYIGSADKVRLATEEDFDVFRCCFSDAYRTEEYEFAETLPV
ncbi:MAG: hypothetical protein AABY15_06955 [Nanoarchaeota archaeon]